MTIKTRRVGKFKVSEKLVREAVNTGHGANLFIGMFVLAADPHWMTGTVTYTAWHPNFEVVDEGCVLPEYEAVFNRESIAPTWVKKGGA